MSYRVFWEPYAEEKLVQLLSDPADGSELGEAAKLIDTALAVDPIGFGESRYDTSRIGFLKPLAILYDVQDDMRTVIVYDVWRTDHKSTQ